MILDAKSIFQKVVTQVHPYTIINKSLVIRDGILKIKDEKVCRFSDYKRIVIIGGGTASGAMARALEQKLIDSKYIEMVDLENSLIIVKENHLDKLIFLKQMEASHPIPDENSLEAGKALIKIADNCDKDTLVFSLISGGASSLIEYYEGHPNLGAELEEPLSLEDNRMVTSTLHNVGCTIQEVNTVRKHFSMIKGGELAKRFYPSRIINLIISDVLSNDLDAVGSGMTVPDTSTWQDVLNIFEKYNIQDRLPKKALLLTEKGIKGQLRETPKPGDKYFSIVSSFLIAANLLALDTARNKATELGYNAYITESANIGDLDDISQYYVDKALDALKKKDKRPICFISTGVALTSRYNGKGKSGRNQSLALSVVDKLSAYQWSLSENDQDSLLFLFASTDGSDGMTDCAGAFASFNQVWRSEQRGLVPHAYLEDNDAYNFFSAVGGLHRTGPTNTNVCDIHIILIR